MKRSIVFPVLMAIALIASLLWVPTVLAQKPQSDVRILVQYAPGQRAAMQNALNAAGARFHYSFDELETFAVTVPAAALAGLQRNPNAVLIEEDALRYPVETIPSLVAATDVQEVPYGIDMVQARDVWDANRDGVIDKKAPTGSNRLICIIDSGLHTGHEDIVGVNVVGGYTNIPGGWDTDGSGHGTHVAGTIAAMNNALGVVGVTPGTVNLYIVRVFGDDGLWAYTSNLINAAYYCRDAGANIISMSLGGGKPNKAEERGFDAMYNQGILIVAAAGNGGTSDLHYPASYNSIISVAAIDRNMLAADFSQFNDQVELAAPGVDVLSTVPYLDISTATVDGITYAGSHIEFSARGSASGNLVDGGRCLTTGEWGGMVVLCERGDISFFEKVMNVQNSGGAAALIYNNVPGGFLGTLGEGNSSAIIGLSLSQEDGRNLVANKLGAFAEIYSELFFPSSSYEAWSGTSMATPHVSAVAALIWSARPTATNVEIRQILAATALDLGDPGRDPVYGFGLVQAKNALDLLMKGPKGPGKIK